MPSDKQRITRTEPFYFQSLPAQLSIDEKMATKNRDHLGYFSLGILYFIASFNHYQGFIRNNHGGWALPTRAGRRFLL